MKISDILNEDDHVVQPEDHDGPTHLVMQLKKASDVGGNRPIKFVNGESVTFPLSVINKFLTAYMNLKPYEREAMQEKASQSRSAFIEALTDATGEQQ